MNRISAILRFIASSAMASASPSISLVASESSASAIHGSLFCNGACLQDPKSEDHVMVVYAIDGSPEIRAEVEKILEDFYPERGLDADSAVMLMDQFTARLKYYVSPQSPALLKEKPPQGHYCQLAAANAVTGEVTVKDGKRWIFASKIEPVRPLPNLELSRVRGPHPGIPSRQGLGDIGITGPGAIGLDRRAEGQVGQDVPHRGLLVPQIGGEPDLVPGTVLLVPL